MRYLRSSGNPEYQSYYTPSDGIFRYSSGGDGEWRWGFNSIVSEHEYGMSFKRSNLGLGDVNYTLTVGDPTGSSGGAGATLNLYGLNANGRHAKIALYNDKQLRGGILANDYELNFHAPEKITLAGLDNETYFTTWRDRSVLIFGADRNNQMHWQEDGDVVLSRNSFAVWNINNYLTSDVRLKTDIKPLEGSSLEKVKQLNAKTYLWKDDLMGKGDKREIGLIAQEVAEVVPEVVSKMSRDSDNLGVAYIQLVPLLVEAVKELSAKVESLEAQLVTKE